jgi:hypothetical protein
LTRLAKDFHKGPGIFAELGHADPGHVYRLHNVNFILRAT